MFAKYISQLGECNIEIHLAINQNVKLISFVNFLQRYNLNDHFFLLDENVDMRKIGTVPKRKFNLVLKFYSFLISKPKIWNSPFILLIRMGRNTLSSEKLAKRILVTTEYKWVVLPTDTTPFTAMWVKVANKLKIKTAVIPWCLSDNSAQLLTPRIEPSFFSKWFLYPLLK